MFRSDKQLPRVRKSKADTAEPKRMLDLNDKLEPTAQSWATETHPLASEKTRTEPNTENADPTAAYARTDSVLPKAEKSHIDTGLPILTFKRNDRELPRATKFRADKPCLPVMVQDFPRNERDDPR
jgi:hypothetical protein